MKNGQLAHELRRVGRRVRVVRAWKAFLWGLAAAGALSLAALTASFFTPMPKIGRIVLIAYGACMLLFPLAAALWPVGAKLCARRADESGLKERARTALELDGASNMERMQIADATEALRQMQLKKAIPARTGRTAPIVAAALALACVATTFLPNPQDAVIRARNAYSEKMNREAERAEELADSLQPEDPNDDTQVELNRLLTELARKLREAGNQRETMQAIDDARVELNRLNRNGAQAAMDALSQAGMDSLGDALSAGDAQALENAAAEAGEGENAQEAADALSKAAEAAQAAGDKALSEALSAYAAAIANGQNASASAGALSKALNGSGKMSAQALLASMKANAQAGSRIAAAGGQGSGNQPGSGSGQSGGGQGSGQSNKPGGGAGKGSTNADQGYSEGSGGGKGNRGGYRMNEGVYEQIYDPTRLGDGGEVSSVTGEVREGQDQVIEMGPGAGTIDGYIPYNRVVGSYAEAAAAAAESSDLSDSARQWANDYFSALTK